MITEKFVKAGKAIFSVSNDKGDHYTYRINHREKTEQWPECWFVSLLTGPNNEDDYTYLGMLDDSQLVRLTAKSKYQPDSLPVKVIRWALKLIYSGSALPPGYSINHCGCCGRCGRLLTVPSSVESGFGPECIKHVS